MRLPACVLLVAAAALAGCSSDGGADPGPWHGRDITEPGWRRVDLQHAFAYELTYNMAAGAVIEWDWFVDGRTPMTFSVHTHDETGRDVEFNRTVGPENKGSFRATQDGLYSLLWKNAGPDAAMYLKSTPGGAPMYFPP